MSAAAEQDHADIRALQLPEVLDLKAAGPLAAELLNRRGEEISIDASRVRRLGGQCLQVLLSAAMTWRTNEIPLAFVDPSPEILEGLRRLGIDPTDFFDQGQPQ